MFLIAQVSLQRHAQSFVSPRAHTAKPGWAWHRQWKHPCAPGPPKARSPKLWGSRNRSSSIPARVATWIPEVVVTGDQWASCLCRRKKYSVLSKEPRKPRTLQSRGNTHPKHRKLWHLHSWFWFLSTSASRAGADRGCMPMWASLLGMWSMVQPQLGWRAKLASTLIHGVPIWKSCVFHVVWVFVPALVRDWWGPSSIWRGVCRQQTKNPQGSSWCTCGTEARLQGYGIPPVDHPGVLAHLTHLAHLGGFRISSFAPSILPAISYIETFDHRRTM